MKIVALIVRLLLGVMFAVFGANAFLHFMPMPPMTGYPAEFIGSMNATGYLYGVGACEVIGGLLLLIGRYIPLGLAILAPIVANIDLYHICMDRSGMPIAIVVTLLFAFLIWRSRAAFAPLFRAV
jgi:uncharacterized membrane protein YphA (DoxX/SURF4 family)